MQDILEKLSHSPFRSKFKLQKKDIDYINQKGFDTIEKHAADFIKTRIAPQNISNDGKQTPMRGHPVFIAQHATATCCRGCIEKWYHIPKGRSLTQAEQLQLVSIIMTWIKNNTNKPKKKSLRGSFKSI